MSSLDPLPPLREVINRHGLMARKSLGQNFLLDLNLTRRIARVGGPLDKGTIIEIGPGPGGLTRALLMEGAKSVLAIEKDQRCLPALAEVSRAYEGRLRVIGADAMRIDIKAEAEAPRRIIANLPYNASTVLLNNWLHQIAQDRSFCDSLSLMFQKEVAERLTARARIGNYGPLSVLTQWLCEVQRLFDIPPGAFTPAPRITSSVVRLTPRAQPLAPCAAEDLGRVCEATFGQRRKMIRQSLRSLGLRTGELIERAGIKETARAEELSVEAFCCLARCYREMRTNCQASG